MGTEGPFATLLTPTLQHCREEGVFTRQQVRTLAAVAHTHQLGCSHVAFQHACTFVAAPPSAAAHTAHCACLGQAHSLRISTTPVPPAQALDYLASKVKGGSRPPGAGPAGGGFQRRTRSRVDEAREILANVVLCHVPVVAFDYQQKVGRVVRGMPAHAPRSCSKRASGACLRKRCACCCCWPLMGRLHLGPALPHALLRR